MPVLIEHREAPGHIIEIDAISNDDKVICNCSCGEDFGFEKTYDSLIAWSLLEMADQVIAHYTSLGVKHTGDINSRTKFINDFLGEEGMQ